MRKLLLIIIAGLLLVAMPAAADTMNYTLVGGFGTITFSLPVNPVPSSFLLGTAFEVDNVSTSGGLDNFVFYSAGDGGGLSDLVGYNLFGPQVYSGPESNPTMLEGVFFFPVTDLSVGAPATLTAELAPVPEPASLALLGTGLIGLGSRIRKRLM